MPNTKPIGVAYSDPELVAGTTITGALLDSSTKIASNLSNGFSLCQEGETFQTTGNNDIYFIAPAAGTLTLARFSATDALATSDTNFITFTLTNLGTTGSGNAAMLSSGNTNTTRATGGTAITANASRGFVISFTANNLTVNTNDRLRLRAAVTGTLANTVSYPTVSLVFSVL